MIRCHRLKKLNLMILNISAPLTAAGKYHNKRHAHMSNELFGFKLSHQEA